jgi:hypothetical protein
MLFILVGGYQVSDESNAMETVGSSEMSVTMRLQYAIIQKNTTKNLITVKIWNLIKFSCI